MKISFLFLVFFVSHIDHIIGIQVLNTPKFLTSDPPKDSFATIANHENVSISELTTCIWALNFYKEDSWFWAENPLLDKRGFRLSVLQAEWSANYVKIGSFFYRYSFPQHFEWLPDTWALFCFSFDNESKQFSIYLNSEHIFKSQEES